MPGARVDGEDIASVADPVPPAVNVMLVRLSVTCRPVGVTVSESFTVPAKQSMLVRAIVELAVDPAASVMKVGLAEMSKSVTVTDTCAEWIMEPFVAVTVTT